MMRQRASSIMTRCTQNDTSDAPPTSREQHGRHYYNSGYRDRDGHKVTAATIRSAATYTTTVMAIWAQSQRDPGPRKPQRPRKKIPPSDSSWWGSGHRTSGRPDPAGPIDQDSSTHHDGGHFNGDNDGDHGGNNHELTTPRQRQPQTPTSHRTCQQYHGPPAHPLQYQTNNPFQAHLTQPSHPHPNPQ